jgi:alpha-1,3-rhamnosyl/mannosyltransferase
VAAVAVNLLWCVPGKVGGSEEYVTRALGPMAEEAPDLELTLYALPGFEAAHPDLADQYEVVVAPVDGERRSVRVAVERTWLAAQVRRRRPSLLHHPGGIVAPGSGSVPVVLSMHDIQYVAYPEYFGTVKLAWLRRQLPSSLARAQVITAPSQFVATSLVDAHCVDPARLVVVPHGLPASFAATPFDEGHLRARYRIPGPFLLYPAATYPHKNHLVLLDALAELGDRPELRLVLTGAPASGEDLVRDAIEHRGLHDRVVRTGRVSDADRDALLRCAEALVFPSRYEGFGAPALEAMAVGTPVLASRETALPEVVGPAGLLLDPDDATAWADAVRSVLDDPALRARLVEAGYERVGMFTAEQSAQALARAYRRLLP